MDSNSHRCHRLQTQHFVGKVVHDEKELPRKPLHCSIANEVQAIEIALQDLNGSYRSRQHHAHELGALSSPPMNQKAFFLCRI